MKKTVTFTDKDKTLVERLEKYKKVKGYKSLIQVVRDLCDDALTLKEISKWKWGDTFFMKKIIKLLSLLFMFAFVFCACSYVDSGVSDTTEEQLSETETIAQEILTEIQGRLKNPDSFKVKNVSYIDSKDYTLKDNPDFKYIFKVDYTGENGFGGVSEGLCYAKYTENGEIKYYDSEDSSDYDGEAAVVVIAYKTTESNGYAVEIDLSKIAVDNLSDITYGNNQ